MLPGDDGLLPPRCRGLSAHQPGLVLMGWPADPDGTIPAFPRDTVRRVLNPSASTSTSSRANRRRACRWASTCPRPRPTPGSHGEPCHLSVEYFDNLGTSQSLEHHLHARPFPRRAPRILDDDACATAPPGGAMIGEYTVVFDDTRAIGRHHRHRSATAVGRSL